MFVCHLNVACSAIQTIPGTKYDVKITENPVKTTVKLLVKNRKALQPQQLKSKWIAPPKILPNQKKTFAKILIPSHSLQIHAFDIAATAISRRILRLKLSHEPSTTAF